MATECTYQFSCPSCSALLQAVLKQALTSVQCGECFDVFDVQMPQLYAPHPWTRERKQPYPEAPCGQCARPHAFYFFGAACLAAPAAAVPIPDAARALGDFHQPEYPPLHAILGVFSRVLWPLF